MMSAGHSAISVAFGAIVAQLLESMVKLFLVSFLLRLPLSTSWCVVGVVVGLWWLVNWVSVLTIVLTGFCGCPVQVVQAFLVGV